MEARTAHIVRETKETRIEAYIDLDGTGRSEIETGLGFLDHMLTSFSHHSRIDLRLQCRGDTEIDGHHTIEDCAIVLGKAIHEALGEKHGITRFGSALVPMDEALARVALDISGRAYSRISLGLKGERIGQVECENLSHFWETFSNSCRVTLHIKLLYGKNDHHRAEAAFKAVALAFRQAITLTPYGDIPSSKGVL